MPPTAPEAIDVGFTGGTVAQPAAARARSAATSATGLPGIRPRIGGPPSEGPPPRSQLAERAASRRQTDREKLPPDDSPRRPGNMLSRAPRRPVASRRAAPRPGNRVYPLWASQITSPGRVHGRVPVPRPLAAGGGHDAVPSPDTGRRLHPRGGRPPLPRGGAGRPRRAQ